MNKNKLKRIASLHSSIWWNDDERLHKKLENNAASLLISLGYDKKKAHNSANNIKQAYYLYGIADDGKISGKKLNQIFDQIEKEHSIAWKKLGFNNYKKIAHYHTMWWNGFYLKSKYGELKTIYYIFLEHVEKFGLINIIPSLKCSYYMIKAGYEGHNKNDEIVATEYLIKYWDIVFKQKLKNKVMY